MNYFLGMDPDTSKQSAVIVNENKEVVAIFMVKTPKSVKGRDAAVWMATIGANRLSSQILDWTGQDLTYNNGIYKVRTCAVEGQQIYQYDTGCKSQDVVNLALVAGALALEGSTFASNQKSFYCPLPRQWKGTVPKTIHQCRTMSKAGLAYEKKGGKEKYPVPTNLDPSIYKGPDKVNPGDWKDVADSLGLALWAREQWIKDNNKRKY